MKLEWKQANIKTPITYRAPIIGEPNIQEWESIASETWTFFVQKIIPLNPQDSWDIVRCEFWMDSGRLIIFVAKTIHEKRVDLGSCELVVSQFSDVWTQCADQHSDSDDDFMEALRVSQKRYARIFATALKQSLHGNRSHPLCGRQVQFWNSDSEIVLTSNIQP